VTRSVCLSCRKRDQELRAGEAAADEKEQQLVDKELQIDRCVFHFPERLCFCLSVDQSISLPSAALFADFCPGSRLRHRLEKAARNCEFIAEGDSDTGSPIWDTGESGGESDDEATSATPRGPLTGIYDKREMKFLRQLLAMTVLRQLLVTN
jgi:hypothetical protein